MKEEERENSDTVKILKGLAREIREMSEEERLLSLKKVVQSELKGNRSRFWTTITKKMLVSDNFLLNEESML